MYVYMEKDTERKRVFLKKEREPPTSPHKRPRRGRLLVFFFSGEGRVGEAKGAFGTNNTNLRTNRVGI
jgi:hypothetical protein